MIPIESGLDILLLGLLGLYMLIGLFSHPLRMFVHLAISVLFLYVFVYGADQLIAAVPALSELWESERDTYAVATGVLIVAVLIIGWLARNLIEDNSEGGFMSMLLCAFLGLLRGSLTVWLLILTTSYLPKNWTEGIWASSAMIRHYSGALETTVGVLPQSDDPSSFLQRLEFDEDTSRPHLNESTLQKLEEVISEQLETLQSNATNKLQFVGSSTKIRLLREQLEAKKRRSQEEKSLLRAPNDENQDNKSLFDTIIDTFAKQDTNLDELLATHNLTEDDLLELAKEDLTEEQFYAKVKQIQQENSVSGSDNDRVLLDALDKKLLFGKQRQELFDEVLAEN